MKKAGVLLLVGMLLLSGCAGREQTAGQPLDGPGTEHGYRQIDQETAKQMMEQDDGHVIVDVRRLDEYESGHIPGAICIPNESIESEKPEELPNPGQTILIYCRSGNRSKQASQKLAELGYTGVYEFGGILTWTGEVVAGQTLALTVESNPTTGYRWEAEQDRELFEVQSYYVAAPQAGAVSGAGGWQTFLLTPKAPGTAELRFTYTRPWESGDGDPQIACTVEISEEFKITLLADGAAEAAESGYVPAVKIY